VRAHIDSKEAFWHNNRLNQMCHKWYNQYNCNHTIQLANLILLCNLSKVFYQMMMRQDCKQAESPTNPFYWPQSLRDRSLSWISKSNLLKFTHIFRLQTIFNFNYYLSEDQSSSKLIHSPDHLLISISLVEIWTFAK
jgi:hypothetical protein